jgi:dolichol-phosphate mannosyltransferase
MRCKNRLANKISEKESGTPRQRAVIQMISIVIPVRDEVDNIFPLVEAIRKTSTQFGNPYEVIFVNDHSMDGTEKQILIAQNAGNELSEFSSGSGRIHLVEVNGTDIEGKEAALKAGFRIVKGDVVITMDGDLQNDPADIPKMLEKLKECDMVCGIRTPRRDIWQKRVASKIANWFRNWVTGDNIKDAGCALQVMRRECVEKILGLEYDLCGVGYLFWPGLLKLTGTKILQVDIKHNYRQLGRSKFNTIRNRAAKGLKAAAKIYLLEY